MGTGLLVVWCCHASSIAAVSTPRYGGPMAVPTDATLAWVADVAASGGRLVGAGPLAEPTSPWWVRIESAAGPTTVVVRARVDGDESSRLIEIERTALEAAGVAGVAAARFIAADPGGASLRNRRWSAHSLRARATSR